MTVTLIAAQQTALKQTTTQPASVHADFEAKLQARVSGYLCELRVDIGDEVKANEILARISVPELDRRFEAQQQKVARLRAEAKRAHAGITLAEAELAAAKAEEDQARAQVTKAKAQLTAEQAEFDRVQELVQRNSVASRLLDETRNRREAARAAQQAAQASVTAATSKVRLAEARQVAAAADLETAQAAVGEADKQLAELAAIHDFATIRAPFPGVITARHVDLGDLVQKMDQAGPTPSRPLLKIAKLDKVRVRVSLPENDAVHADTGDSVRIRFRALPGKPRVGNISRTARGLDTATRTMLVEIDLDNPDRDLLPGMYGEATITLSEQQSAMVLPHDVVRYDEQGHAYVFVVDALDTLQSMPIRVGSDDGNLVEIRSGLTGTESVVGPSVQRLRSGQRVRLPN